MASTRRPSIVATVAWMMAALVLASPARAQAANRPDAKAGDQWRFAVYHTVPSTPPNWTSVISSVASGRVEGTANGEPLTLIPELNGGSR